MHDTYLLKRYPNFNVYIRSIVSILLRIYLITSKSHHMPPIILSFPFDVVIQQFVRSDDTNNYIKLKGSSSPWLIQVYLFCCIMTKSCDCDPSFDAMSCQLYEHRLGIFTTFSHCTAKQADLYESGRDGSLQFYVIICVIASNKLLYNYIKRKRKYYRRHVV